jgi:hypothetical protein
VDALGVLDRVIRRSSPGCPAGPSWLPPHGFGSGLRQVPDTTWGHGTRQCVIERGAASVTFMTHGGAPPPALIAAVTAGANHRRPARPHPLQTVQGWDLRFIASATPRLVPSTQSLALSSTAQDQSTILARQQSWLTQFDWGVGWRKCTPLEEGSHPEHVFFPPKYLYLTPIVV